MNSASSLTATLCLAVCAMALAPAALAAVRESNSAPMRRVARRFYTDVLRFEIVNRGEFTTPVRAPSNFGSPANLVVSQPLPFTIVGPRRDGPTPIELVQIAWGSVDVLAVQAPYGAWLEFMHEAAP